MKYQKLILTAIVLLLLTAAVVYFCRTVPAAEAAPDQRILYSAAGGTVKSLDPAFADDLASRDLTALCYDTLVQYDYLERPYKLKPSMLRKMPDISADGKSYICELRDDL